MTTDASTYGFVILPFLTEEPEVTTVPEKGLLPEIAQIAQSHQGDGFPVFRFSEGQWQIRQADKSTLYVPAQLRAVYSALQQWRRAGIEHLFPEDRQSAIQSHLITNLMHETLTAVPQYHSSIRCESTLIDEYHSFLKDPDSSPDFDERQWTCDYLRARRTAIRACQTVGAFLQAQMEDLLLTQTVNRTTPYQYLLQAQLVGQILQLAGTFIGADACFPEPIRLRHLMRLMYNGRLLSPDDLRSFQSIKLPTEPELEGQIRAQLAEIKTTHDTALGVSQKAVPNMSLNAR